jgi:uncharacterized protein YchJ
MVDQLEDRIDVLERLESLYTEQGMILESEEIEQKLAEIKSLSNVREWRKIPGKNSPVTLTTKIGRNDPCLCGSGKKYKKCCG